MNGAGALAREYRGPRRGVRVSDGGLIIVMLVESSAGADVIRYVLAEMTVIVMETDPVVNGANADSLAKSTEDYAEGRD